MRKYFKCVNSVPTGSIYITENSVVVYQELTTKRGRKNIDVFVQGSDSKLNKNSFDDLLSRNILIEIHETTELIDYVNNYVIEPKEFSDRKKLISKAKRDIPQFESIISTISAWVFSTKGSPAVTLTTEKSFIENPDKFLTGSIFSGGMKAKPGSPFKNRGTRQTSVSDVAKWENDKTTLLPNGIRKSDSCSYQMSCQIFDKIITDILSIYDIPKEFYEYFLAKGYKPREKKLVDYYYKTPISWELFKQNTHHSKVKGLEFCHLNPELEYTTQVENISIGTSESNRHQGGYSSDFTWRKQLIKRIYDIIKTDENYLSLQSDLDKLTNEELEEMYFKIKFQ